MSSSRCVMEARERSSPSSSSFIKTCNLLSQYVKERGSLRDLNIEIGGKVESLEAIVKPGSSLAASSSGNAKSAHQTSSVAGQASGVDSTVVVVKEGVANRNSKSREKPFAQRKPAQLTIFYSGKVLVFDDCPMAKARELVSIAKKSSSQMSYGILSNTLPEKPNRSTREGVPPRPQGKQSMGISSNTWKEKPDIATSKAAVTSEKTNSTDSRAAAAAWSSKEAQEHVSLQSEANGSDLPIARRSSIHRFLEKRKDRASVRMPYHDNQEQPGSSSSSSLKGDGELDLNL